MKPRLIAAAVFAAGVLAGVLYEHYLGTASIVDWSGLRHADFIRRSRATGDRIEVSLEELRGKRTMVALVFGQSNAANGGEKPGSAHPAVHEFYNGRLYKAQDPLLGADGSGGSIWLRLGAKAVESGEFEFVVLVPFAVGATAIARWAPGGSLHDALLATIARAHASGLRFTHLLWQHGEADAQAGTGEAAYRDGFLAMLAAIRRLGVDAPIHVALATRCNKLREAPAIRSAQTGLSDPAASIRVGPDMDALGFDYRYDGCHFSSEGLEQAADRWWNVLRQENVKRDADAVTK